MVAKVVTPWIALASGYRRQTDKYHEWSHDWNYDLIYSWQLGVELNNAWYGVPERAGRFAPWNKAKIAIFSIAHLSDDERMFFVTLLLVPSSYAVELDERLEG